MRCENIFCIYQKNGECILDEIEIDISGKCASCIFPNIDDDYLQKAKAKTLNRIDS